MTARRVALVAGPVAAVALLAWLLFIGLPRWYGGPATSTAAATKPSTVAPPGRKIKAHLFYVADDGVRLVSVERDVPFGEGTVQQAKEIIGAQIAPVAAPLLSAIPPGTTLRALFITATGDAYVDLSREVSAMHPGGSVSELLTVYTVVDALTANLPAVSGVQILVDGKAVDTLAGHADLRRPLGRNLSWVQ
jgi:sporulation and spore germination protein